MFTVWQIPCVHADQPAYMGIAAISLVPHRQVKRLALTGTIGVAQETEHRGAAFICKAAFQQDTRQNRNGGGGAFREGSVSAEAARGDLHIRPDRDDRAAGVPVQQGFCLLHADAIEQGISLMWDHIRGNPGAEINQTVAVNRAAEFEIQAAFFTDADREIGVSDQRDIGCGFVTQEVVDILHIGLFPASKDNEYAVFQHHFQILEAAQHIQHRYRGTFVILSAAADDIVLADFGFERTRGPHVCAWRGIQMDEYPDRAVRTPR